MTDIGQSLYPLSDGVLNDLDNVLRRVGDHRAMKSGLVRIATSQLLAPTLMPEPIAAYQASTP